MHAKHKTETIPCTPGAFPGGLTRTRFYDGMLLTQTHLEREQKFWRMKRKLTNRALGTGVVWGLRLEWDANKHKFLLSPGYALDCCGNDLVVECPQEITERTLINKHDQQLQALLSGQDNKALKCPEPEPDLPVKVGLVLQYTECAGDPQPVFEDDCTSNVTHCEYSSIRESAKLCLVPLPNEPKPTPIDAFCTRLEALKQECVELTGCTLFDLNDSLATDAFPVYIEVRNITEDTPPDQIQPDAANDANVTVEVTLPATSDQMQVTIKPAPGYVIMGGELAASSGVSFVPFGGEFDATGADFLTAGGPALTITGLQVCSLLTNETHVKANVALSMGTEEGNNYLRVITTEFEKLPIVETCNDNLSPWLIFNKPPECTLKTLALVALCGWFKGLLANDPEVELTGKHVTAWWVCYLAWKILFGANLDDTKASVLNEALKDLLEEWCAAFFYPGPYCQNSHHGVYLGGVEISSKGNVVSFDPWAYRRYVITGPLLTHWGSLVGLAPIDVVAGRFASWICCLGSTSSPAVPADVAANMIDGLPIDQFGMAIVAGDEAAVDAYLDKYNLTKTGSIETISVNEFVARILDSSTRTMGENLLFPDVSKGTLMTGRAVYAVENIGMFLLEPAVSGRGSLKPLEHERARISRMVEARTASLRPLARGLVNDYAVEIVRAIELGKIKAVSDESVMTALVDEVSKHRIVTIDDYLKAGPARAAKLALINFDELDEVEDKRDLFMAAEELTLASEAVLDSVIEPFVEDRIETGGGPLLADTLADAETAKVIGRSLRPQLKANALTNARVKEIGERVAERHELVLDRPRE
jgi:hypothetical protein